MAETRPNNEEPAKPETRKPDASKPEPSKPDSPKPDSTERAMQQLRESLAKPNAPLRPHPRPLPTKPRRVSGGVRLKRKEGEDLTSVPEQRLMRLLELSAGPTAIEEGLEYARLGQTRSLIVEPGLVRASVMGRRTRAYDVQLHVDAFTPEQWDAIADQLNESPHIAAEVLGGRLPADVEEVFKPLGLSLLPASPDAVRITSTCPDTPRGLAEGGGWSKHACCVVMLLSERIAADPKVAFHLRGLPDGELAERMSHRRLLSAGGANPRPIYQPRVEGASDAALPDEAATLERFWEARGDLESLDLSLEPPAVATPMLRRLGPSPFEDAGFPLVGLLATCYEVARERLLKEESGEVEPESGPDVEQQPVEEDKPAEEAQAEEPARRPKTAEERAAAIRAKMMGKAKGRK